MALTGTDDAYEMELLKAVGEENLDRVVELVKIYGLSSFHMACSRDEPKLVERLLKHGAPINQQVEAQSYVYKKFSPLHFAAKFKCKETMEVLLKKGADMKQKDFQEMTALHIAAKESCLETVSLLLQYGADVCSIDSHGKTPVHRAFETKNYGIIDLLLSAPNVTNSNPSDDEDLSHFHIACTRSNVNVVKSFIENGVDLDSRVDDNGEKRAYFSGYSPLHFAVVYNRAKVVQLLLRSGVKFSKIFTPLRLACSYQGETFGEFIKNILFNLGKRGKISQQSSTGPSLPQRLMTDIARVDVKHVVKFSGSIGKLDWSPHRRDHFRIINCLLEYGSDVNSIDIDGNMPIFYAFDAVTRAQRIFKNNLNCSENLFHQINESLSKELYERRKLILQHLTRLDVNLNKCFVRSSILYAIVHKNDRESSEMIKFFLKKGADVNARTSNGFTPLHVACHRKQVYALQWLLDYAADINIEDNAGRSICCHLYDKYLKNVPENQHCATTLRMMKILQKHIVKMKAIGLPISEKVLSANSKFDSLQPLDEQEKKELTEKYESEVRLLRDTEINDNYTLRDVMFKDENSLSQLVKNPAFADIVKSESFKQEYPNYGYSIQSNYRKGVDRGNYLPEAKVLLNKLMGMHLPETCSENICKYFSNSELKESLEILRGILDSNMNTSDDQPLTIRKSHKRQRVI